MDSRIGQKECLSCKKLRLFSDFYSSKYATCRFCILVRRAIVRRDLKKEVLSHYSNGDSPQCSCCKESIIEFLSIDHIGGGGKTHRADVSGGSGGINFYRWLKKNAFPTGYQVLCHNCNQAIGAFGSCPHQHNT